MITAYALEQQKKREEEEAAQIAQVTAEVEVKNAAIEAGRIAMMSNDAELLARTSHTQGER